MYRATAPLVPALGRGGARRQRSAFAGAAVPAMPEDVCAQAPGCAEDLLLCEVPLSSGWAAASGARAGARGRIRPADGGWDRGAEPGGGLRHTSMGERQCRDHRRPRTYADDATIIACLDDSLELVEQQRATKAEITAHNVLMHQSGVDPGALSICRRLALMKEGKERGRGEFIAPIPADFGLEASRSDDPGDAERRSAPGGRPFRALGGVTARRCAFCLAQLTNGSLTCSPSCAAGWSTSCRHCPRVTPRCRRSCPGARI